MKKITLALLLFAPLSLWLGHDADASITAQADIAAGYGHTCRINGTTPSDTGYIGPIECRGYNSYGQLGRGTADQVQHPTWVTPTGLAGLNFVAVATSSASTCAVQDSGFVWCWGYNGDGELGDGTRVNKSVPQKVNLVIADYIVAGAGHYCALGPPVSGFRRLQCWGWNNHGQVGNNTTSDALLPVEIKAADTNTSPLWKRSLAAGYDFTCGISGLQTNFNNQAVYCWGDNARGQLGNGMTTDAHQPRGSTAMHAAGDGNVFAGIIGQNQANLVDVYDIGANAWGACLFGTIPGSSTKLYCWGDNTNGQVWTNGSVDATAHTIPYNTGRGGIQNISTGNYGLQMCVTTNDMFINCWGGNNNQEAGGPTTTAAAFHSVKQGSTVGGTPPHLIQAYMSNPNHRSIAAGAWHTLVGFHAGAQLYTQGMGADCFGETGAPGKTDGTAEACVFNPLSDGLFQTWWPWQM